MSIPKAAPPAPSSPPVQIADGLQQQDPIFRDPVPPLRNDANYMVLDLLDSGSALERNSGIVDTPRDLRAAEPNSDGRISTNLWHHEHRPVDLLHNNYSLPSHSPSYQISSEQTEVWQAQTLRGEGSPRRADSRDMTLKPRHAPSPTPEIRSSPSSTMAQRNFDNARLLVNQRRRELRLKSACSTCRKRRVKCDEKEPSCKSLLSSFLEHLAHS